MGEIIYLDEYISKKKQKELQHIEDLKAELQRLIIENNLNFCEDPGLMWYNINNGEHPDDQEGHYVVIDPSYYLDYDYYGSDDPEDK